MPSCQRILADINNAAQAAVATTDAIKPAAYAIFRQPTQRAGFGAVALSGDYVGADDAVFDIEIRPSVSGDERTTQPVFVGAGNGTLRDATAAAGTVAQTIVAACVNLGTTTTYAQVILDGDVLLRAKAAGTTGNSLRLSITTELTLSTQPIGALAADLPKDAQEWTDQKLDFGAVALNPDGSVPTTAPRLVFGRDTSQVYRHYKRWDGSQWQYGVSPKLRTDYSKDTLINTIVGTYTCTLTQGAVTETFSALTTLYHLLLALAASNLVTVVTPIGNDNKPNGMAAVDVPVRTAAFALPATKSRPELPNLTAVTATASAPTETVTVTCTDDSAANAEVWAVVSQVLGTRPPAKTGVAYASGYIGFTLPKVTLQTAPVQGGFAITGESYPRTASDTHGVPDICLYRPILGTAAKDTTLKLIWTQRPAGAGCNCLERRVNGHPVEAYLGIDLGDDDVMTIPAAYQTRLQALYGWRATFMRNNTQLGSGGLYGSSQDLDLCEAITTLFADALADGIYEDSAAATEWSNALTAMQSDLSSIATEAGIGPDGWPTSAKFLRSGITLSVGDYLRSESEQATPGVYKVTALIVYKEQNNLDANNSALLTAGPVYASGPFNTVAIDPAQWLTDRTQGAFVHAVSGSATKLTAALVSTDSHLAGTTERLEQFVRRYQAKMDQIRAMAGIVPKASARLNGNAVWRDLGENYWQIEGTPYLPVFNNTYYHACVERYDPETQTTTIVPTLEFGFGLRVDCPERLQPGDSITITIGNLVIVKPYQKGDQYQVAIVAGRPLSFAGGATGNNTLTWTVSSSVQGALTNYALTDSEPAYSAGGIGFRIRRGSLSFALGDAFTFAIETGGRFRWRANGGAWSAVTAFAADLPVSLSDGLSVIFSDGKAPSFVSGDRYLFQARQPNSPNHVKTADETTWCWPSAAASLTLTFAAATVTCVGLLRHALPAGATASITLYGAGGVLLGTTVLPVRSGPMLAFLAAPVVAVSATVTITNAMGGAVGWVYIGDPWAATYSANQCTLRRVYAMERDASVNPRGAYLGAGRGGELVWENWFLDDDWLSLLAMIDRCKADGDRPVVVTPNLVDTHEAALVRLATDDIARSDEYRFQDPDFRQMSLTLPFTAVVM